MESETVKSKRNQRLTSVNTVGILHITDTLDTGGAERMAVNLANLIPRDRFRAHLCTTRRDGLLADLVADDVGRLRLSRLNRFDVMSLKRMARYIHDNRISILHAHGTSLFIAAAVSLFCPRSVVIWHDHYGRYKFDDRPTWLYRIAAKRLEGVVAVNKPLVDWSVQSLGMAKNRVWYIPNFVYSNGKTREVSELPGKHGSRIVCVANFRPEKDHVNLIRAMRQVVLEQPEAHLLLIGAEIEASCLDRVRQEVRNAHLEEHVSFLGQQKDVPGILKQCSIGVLSSASEGLPLSLLEYGMAGLPVVATDVGQCAEVLEGGQVGALVPSSAPTELAQAILMLLKSPEKGFRIGALFRRRIEETYSPQAVLDRVVTVYDTVLNSLPRGERYDKMRPRRDED